MENHIMQRGRRTQRAFTLVELLAVISILVLLVSFLMPVLSSARELSRRVKCLDQYRQIGQALHGFAAAHLERGPGNAWTFTTTDPAQWITDEAHVKASRGWKGMIEAEYFHTKPNAIPRFPAWLPLATVPNKSVGYSSDLQTRKQQLACPSARVSIQNYCRREMCVGDDFDGRGSSARNNISFAVQPMEGECGLIVDPPPAPWTVYTLGPRYLQYPSPSTQFAVWESDWAGDNTGQYNGNPDRTVDGVHYNGLTWIGHNGQYAFRHYNRTAVFLLFDGHVEPMGTTDRIMGKERYAYRLN